jgi:hypothetical protein
VLGSRLGLDGDPAAVDREKEEPLSRLLEELVDRLLRAVPPVVVDEEDAAGG